MSNNIKPLKDLEPVKEDEGCVCNCMSLNESVRKEEETIDEKCCD
jgi:hypothetical protein